MPAIDSARASRPTRRVSTCNIAITVSWKSSFTYSGYRHPRPRLHAGVSVTVSSSASTAFPSYLQLRSRHPIHDTGARIDVERLEPVQVRHERANEIRRHPADTRNAFQVRFVVVAEKEQMCRLIEQLHKIVARRTLSRDHQRNVVRARISKERSEEHTS